MRISIAIIAVFLVAGCQDHDTGPASCDRFALFFLKDSTITTVSAAQVPIESLSLAGTPFLTENDLTYYDWTNHSFAAHAGFDSMIAAMRTLGGNSRGVPFVVVAERERIYLGSFWWAYSSLMPPVPSIEVFRSSPYHIERAWTDSMNDVRNDPRIYHALQKAGILVQ